MSNAITKKATGKLSIRDHLMSDAMKNQIAKALPKHMSADRMSRIAITAMTRTPKLQQCTPESFFKCLLDLSAFGLEPDGRQAHLIPYGNQCTLILDYKGLVTLAYRAGAKSIHADVIFEGDLFTYNLGRVEQHTPHAFRIDAGKPKKKGNMIGAFCIVQLEGDAVKCEVMTKGEIDGIRDRSRSGKDGPWVSDYTEMAKKTVFRRASKWIPLSAEMRDALERDDDKIVDGNFTPVEMPSLEDRVATVAKVTKEDKPKDDGMSDSEKHFAIYQERIDGAEDQADLSEIAAQLDSDDSLPTDAKATLIQMLNEASKELS